MLLSVKKATSTVAGKSDVAIDSLLMSHSNVTATAATTLQLSGQR